jgi:magnesium-transporting ATPase (P-type)
MFKISKHELMDLVDKYKSRTYDEEIVALNEHDGAKGIAQKLNTDIKTGLKGGIDFPDRTAAFGNNQRPVEIAKSFCSIFIDALNDFMMKVLIVAATAALVFGYIGAKPEDYHHVWIDSVAIYLAVLVVSGVGSIVDWFKEREFVARTNEENAENKLIIIRDNESRKMHVNELHVGDVIELKYGLIIPVDGIVIESQQLSTNEAAMTGESDACRKDSLENCMARKEEVQTEEGYSKQSRGAHDLPSPLMLSGTEVVGGTGQMLVLMVGDNSALGQIMAKLRKPQGQTPLQKKLELIATDVGKLGTYFATATVHVLLVRFFIDGVLKRQVDLFGGEKEPTGQKLFFAALLEWVEFFTIGVAVVVVAIPEGLPLAVMLSLAYSQRMMLLDNNYVKKLAACEIMGGATNICSDKTGTLTLNQMKVTDVWVGKEISIPNEQEETTNEKGELIKKMKPITASDYFPNQIWRLIEMSIGCNIPKKEDFSATDQGMYDLLERAGTSVEKLQKQHLENMIRFPFTSKRKRMSTIIS